MTPEQRKKYKDAAVALGLCLVCWKRRPREENKICDDCITKGNNRRNERQIRNIEKGLCHCGKERENPELKNCLRCRRRSNVRGRRYRIKIKIKVTRQSRTSVKYADLN